MLAWGMLVNIYRIGYSLGVSAGDTHSETYRVIHVHVMQNFSKHLKTVHPFFV